MLEVSRTIEIEAPVERAWTKLSKLDDVERWAKGVLEARYHTPNTTGVGAGRTCEIEGFGTLVEEAVEWEDGVGFTLSIQGMPAIVASASGSWALEPAGPETTRATMTLKLQTRFWPVGALLERFVLGPKFVHQAEATTAAFKAFVEGSKLELARKAS